MNIFKTIIGLLCVSMICAEEADQLSGDPGHYFHAGYYEEVVKGNLSEAIRLYEKCLETHNLDRSLAAKSHFHLALCYEAMGKEKAVSHYQIILDQFSDQTEISRLARNRLKELRPKDEIHPLVRYYIDRVYTTPGHKKSFDGKWLAYTDWETGHLMLQNLTDKGTVPLTISDSLGEDRFAYCPVWSKDSRTLMYSYHWAPNSSEVRTVDITVGQTYAVYSKPGQVAFPLDVSPDGSTLLCRAIDFKNDSSKAGRLLFINTETGHFSSIVHLDPNSRGLSFSPAGDAIVFDAVAKKGIPQDSQEREIFVMPLTDFIPIRVTGEFLSFCNTPVWGPDSTIIYQSFTQGNYGLWTVKINRKTKQPAGNPVRLISDFNTIIQQEFNQGNPLSYSEKLPWEDPSSLKGPDECGFREEFENTTLDDAWRIFEWKGPNIYGFKTFGHYSLFANPGSLRYITDPAALAYNFIKNFLPDLDSWWYWYYPALEIIRPFSGQNWKMDTKVTFHMVDGVNGRAHRILIYFGPENDAKTIIIIERYKEFDINISAASDLIVRFFDKGKILAENHGAISPADSIGVTAFTYYFEIIREREQVRILVSEDGFDFREVLALQLPDRVLNSRQWVSLNGFSWFNPARSYADWDYIRLEPIVPQE